MKHKKRKAEIAELESCLKAYQRRGTRVTLEGQEYEVSRIARACVKEEGATYMGDYIFDDTGKLVELRFDKIELL